MARSENLFPIQRVNWLLQRHGATEAAFLSLASLAQWTADPSLVLATVLEGSSCLQRLTEDLEVLD